MLKEKGTKVDESIDKKSFQLSQTPFWSLQRRMQEQAFSSSAVLMAERPVQDELLHEIEFMKL